MDRKQPDRIWIEADGECPYFYHESELSDAAPPVVEYIRADLVESDGWVSAEECPAESGYYDVWAPGYGRYPNAYWWDEWLNEVAGHSISPTHWRPLPIPPGGDHD